MKTRSINVAVVDDDSSYCRALERLLRAYGFTPLIYSSAESFLRDSARPRVDCMILDIHLDGMSGFALQSQLAQAGSVPPIIFMTADEGPDTLDRARRAGCAEFLNKPFVGKSLLEAIRRALAAADKNAGS
jgi:FixJ family two-component response regulator